MDFGGGRDRAAVQGWLFDVHLRLGVSVNTMSSRCTPAAVAAPAAVVPLEAPGDGIGPPGLSSVEHAALRGRGGERAVPLDRRLQDREGSAVLTAACTVDYEAAGRDREVQHAPSASRDKELDAVVCPSSCRARLETSAGSVAVSSARRTVPRRRSRLTPSPCTRGYQCRRRPTGETESLVFAFWVRSTLEPAANVARTSQDRRFPPACSSTRPLPTTATAQRRLRGSACRRRARRDRLAARALRTHPSPQPRPRSPPRLHQAKVSSVLFSIRTIRSLLERLERSPVFTAQEETVAALVPAGQAGECRRAAQTAAAPRLAVAEHSRAASPDERADIARARGPVTRAGRAEADAVGVVVAERPALRRVRRLGLEPALDPAAERSARVEPRSTRRRCCRTAS